MDGQHRISLPLVRFNRRKESTTLKGPLRVVRLCILSILLPGLLIAGPLYLRYRVYSEQVYPVGISDMRLVDNKISTTWCQKQLVKSNATFNAYLLPEEPKLESSPLHVSMVKYLNLEDDMKEYWGFYLLKGSSVTVSTCCRWPGASLIVIKGHSHLRECAYIGDDSSEEFEELQELEKQKEEVKGKESWPLRIARPSIEFHDSHEPASELRKLGAGAAAEGDARARIGGAVEEKPKATKQDVSAERNRNSEEIYDDIMNRIASLGSRKSGLVSRLKKVLKLGSQEKERGGPDAANDATSSESKIRKREITLWSLERELTREDGASDAAEEEDLGTFDDIRGTINGTTANDMSNSEFWSSFSSSEERLMSCAGLILNLPLTPSKSCHSDRATVTNKFTYKVSANGYYFFVFGSENEIQPNHIRIHFQLEKIMYNVSNPVAACTNTTESCSLPLDFFSTEKVVLEMPANSNDTLWNEEYVVVSVCEPRTIVYAACVVAVPVLILLFAF